MVKKTNFRTVHHKKRMNGIETVFANSLLNQLKLSTYIETGYEMYG